MLNTKYSQSGCIRHTHDPFFEEVERCIGSNIISHPDVYMQCVKYSSG
ncbi:hypothetical protein ACFLVU_03315 [Chloroflexota bacterium]